MLSDLIALSGGMLLSKIVGFFAFAYLARVLEPEAFGAMELAIALSVVFSLGIQFGFEPVGVRAIVREPESAAEYARRIPGARLLFALVAIPLMCVSILFMGQPHETVLLVWLFAVSLLAVPWDLRWLLQGLEMMTSISVAQVLKMVVFLLGVGLFVNDSTQLLNVGLIELLAAGSMAGYYLFLQTRRIAPLGLELSISRLKPVVSQSVSIGITQVAWALGLYLPIVMVGLFSSSAETAWFGAAHRVVGSLFAFTALYHFNMFPTIAHKLIESHHSFKQFVSSSYNVASWGGIFIALVISVQAEAICRFIYGKEFSAAAVPLQMLVWTIPIGLLSGHARWSLIAAGRQRWVMFAQILGTLITISLSMVFIPLFGAVGSAGVMVLATIGVSIAMHVAAARHIGTLPLLGPVLRPGVLAGICIFAAWLVPGLSWWPLVICGLFPLMAPLVDPRLRHDLKQFSLGKNVTRAAQADSKADFQYTDSH